MSLFNSQKLWFQRDYRGWAIPFALLIIWYLLTRFNLVNTHIMAPPQAVFLEGYQQLITGNFLLDLIASLSRNLAGLFLGGFIGFLLGLLMGISRYTEKIVAPSFNTLKQIAIFAWIPLISAWFGMGESGKVVFIALAAFYPMTINVFEGVRNISHEYIEVARVNKLNRWQFFSKLVFPASLPQVMTGVHLALIYSWLATIGSEYFLKSGHGVGNSMIDGREHFNMGSVLFGVIVVGLIGSALNLISYSLEKKLLSWRDGQN
jgi:sulfonate transport system permease protein